MLDKSSPLFTRSGAPLVQSKPLKPQFTFNVYYSLES